MIYLKRTNPVDAKPGDLMFIEGANSEYFGLYVCINMHGGTIGNDWHPAKCFNRKEYEAIGEIVDGKPTPELIARFATPEARESWKRFEAPNSSTLIYRDGTIFEISNIRPHSTNRAYLFHLTSDKLSNNDVFNTYHFESIEQAERERARLISWLEEA